MLSSMATEARIYYARHNHYAFSLTAMGADTKELDGKYYRLADAVGRDEQGEYLRALPQEGNPSDGSARYYLKTRTFVWD